jgi:hypothetical protein
MLKKPYRIAALLATLAAAGAMAVAAAPAGAAVTPCTAAEQEVGICVQITAPFIGYHVSGTFTTKGGAGQVINLPVTGGPLVEGGKIVAQNHPGFTGYAIIALRSPLDPRFTGNFNQGSINSKCPGPPIFTGVFENPLIQFLLHPCGNISPPFTQSVEFPEKSGEHQVAGFTTEESPKESGCAPEFPLCSTPSGEFHTTAPSNCPTPVLGESIDCIREVIAQSIRLGYSVHGPGNGAASQTQSQCETSVPAKFNLEDNLTFEEFAFVGSRFVGSFNTPTITCSGKYANGRGNQMTESFGGPTNYVICVQPVVSPPPGVHLEGCPHEFPHGPPA